MAGFKIHVTVSSCWAADTPARACVYGLPLDTAILGGALCGFSGMLPDLDSDYGTPLARDDGLHRRHRCRCCSCTASNRSACGRTKWRCSASRVYLFMRFGITNMIRKYTVHRGMFHSIPAGLIFAGVGVPDLRRHRRPQHPLLQGGRRARRLHVALDPRRNLQRRVEKRRVATEEIVRHGRSNSGATTAGPISRRTPS